jgi:hypothetical protein
VFAQFWDTYPRKVGKAAARRMWCMAIRRGADVAQVIAAAEHFRNECRIKGTEQRFIPHPSKWLSDGRYADEDEAAEEAPIAPIRPSVHPQVNDEQLLAAVIRLACDQVQPITAAKQIIALVGRREGGPADAVIAVSSERARELAAMPYREEYLESPEWQARRQIMLKRAGYRCQVCNRGDLVLNVHHRTYERRGDETIGDLVVLCYDCHGLFHGKGQLADEPGDIPPGESPLALPS